MATDKNFIVKNGLEVGGQEVISSSGVVTSAALGGQTLASTDSPTFNDLTLTGDLNLSGELNITGDINSLSVTDLDVADKTITLGAGQVESASGGSGIIVDGSGASILWDETNDEFDINKSVNVAGAVIAEGASFGTTSDAQTIVYVISSTTGESELRLGDTDTDAGSISYTNSNDTLTFRAAAANRMSLNSSGLDVTGTVTSDGLTVDGNATISNATNPKLEIIDTTIPNTLLLQALNGDSIVGTSSNTSLILKTNNLFRITLSNGGDISFYEDTGTTAKLFWDASSEVLGIGNTSPSASYSIDAAKGVRSSGAAPNFTLQETDAGNQTWLMASYAGNFAVRDTTVAGTAYPLQIEPATPSNTLYLDSTGKVGIGTSNPSFKLDIEGADNSQLRLLGTDTNPTTLVMDYNNTGSTDRIRIKNDAGDMKLTTSNGQDRITILKAGNVGIGTDSPDAPLHVSDTSPHIDIGPQGGNRGKIGYHSNDVIIGSTSSTGNIIFKNNISSTDSPQTSGDVKMTIADVGLTIHSDTYNILNLQTDSNNDQTSTDGIIKITNNDGSSDVTKAEFRWDESEDLVHVSYGDHGRHVSINSTGKVGIGTGSTSPTATLEVAGTALVENAKLKAIAESNTDTAVDVFVYDTRKDSDGGAWRKRTQHTSWYNEALNTSTRGARKEFPCVAVIVIASNNVIIYDGDDPDMPMWMVFPADAYITWASNSDTGTSCVSALNSKLFIGNSNDYGDCIVDFVSDDTRLVYNNNNYALTKRTVVDRNILESTEFPLYYAGGDGYNIVNPSVNDVAMTVLPNAPIDPDTGLPVPTIAVATNGGVSVIKDDGSVVDITASAGASYNGVGFISFDSNHNMIFEQDNVGRSLFYMPIPSADTTSTTSSAAPTDKKMLPSSSANTTFPKFNGSNATLGIGGSGGDQYIHGGTGVTHYAQGPSDATSSVAYITSDYNTGWMHGNIKLATLSDTDTTNVTGTELITNGAFDSNTTGWTASDAGCSLSLVSNQLRITNNDATAGGAVTSFSVVSGEVYTFSVGTSSGTVQLYLGAAPNTATYFGPVISNSTTWTSTVTGTVYFMVKNVSTTNGATVDIDNISVRLGEEDRSVNGKGLQVFGTITKTAVATGAELVGYSGFSTSNYLQQPYNSDLDFGTGDFALMCWAYTSSSSYGIHETYISRAGRAFDISKTTLENYRFYITPATYISTTSVNYNTWVHIVALRRNGRCSIYIDGIEQASGTVTTNIAPGYSDDDQLMIGLRRASGLSQPSTNSKLALARISATAPTDEQIKKMYNDEKHLFQENAKATLYGSSDAVTALAYDDDTELLHVGTSAGRSLFQGLNRVDNTTDAVGAAISASNGLVVED